MINNKKKNYKNFIRLKNSKYQKLKMTINYFYTDYFKGEHKGGMKHSS